MTAKRTPPKKKEPIALPELSNYATILSVDPGLHKPGWALLRVSEELIDAGSLDVPHTGTEALFALAQQVRLLVAERLSQGSLFLPDLLLFEAQYTPKNKDGTIKSMGGSVHVVGQSAGVWVGAITSRYLAEVAPATWGAAFGLGRYIRERKKEAAVAIAKQFYPCREWTDDSADALLMGLWAAKKIKQRRIFARLDKQQGIAK